MLPMPKQFSSSFSSGFGATLGVLVAIALAAGGYQAYTYLAEPIPVPAKDTRIGTPEQAKAAALSALRKRGVFSLAKEASAAFSGNQWAVSGPAKNDAGKLVQVSVLLSVGTIDGTRHWKTEYMEIDGKQYVGK